METRNRELFGGRVMIAITTKMFGEVHPKKEDFSQQLLRLKELTGSSAILFPSLEFTNQVVWGDKEEEGSIETFPDYSGQPLEGFLRSPYKADAGISSALPIAICNGDCPPGIAVTTPDSSGRRYLVFMHLGLMSMISKTGRTSLIEEVLTSVRSKGLDLEGFWMGYGARACCYGLGHGDDRWELIRKWQPEELTIEKGPRSGQGGVDLGVIARNQLLHLGVSADKIEIDDLCTVCCGADPETGEHFSNLMRHGATARNGVVAWLK